MKIFIGLFACVTVINAASFQYQSPNADSKLSRKDDAFVSK